MSQLGMACGMLVSEPSELNCFSILQAVDWFFSGKSVELSVCCGLSNFLFLLSGLCGLYWAFSGVHFLRPLDSIGHCSFCLLNIFQAVHLMSPLSLPCCWSSFFPFYYASSPITGPLHFHTITKVIFQNEVLILLFPSLYIISLYKTLICK